MRFDVVTEVFQVRAEVDRLLDSIPEELPDRAAGSVEAHLEAARDSLTAAYRDLLDAELGILRKKVADFPALKAIRDRVAGIKEPTE